MPSPARVARPDVSPIPIHDAQAPPPKFVTPVGGPRQLVLQGFEWNDYIITEVSEAADLIEVAQMAGFSIRTMTDVLLVQKHKRPAPFEHNYSRNSFISITLPQPYLDGQMGALHI